MNDVIMLEVIYRIYEVIDKEKQPENVCVFGGVSNNIELTMDCKICESREHFKELIKEEYGNIAFRNSKFKNITKKIPKNP